MLRYVSAVNSRSLRDSRETTLCRTAPSCLPGLAGCVAIEAVAFSWRFVAPSFADLAEIVREDKAGMVVSSYKIASCVRRCGTFSPTSIPFGSTDRRGRLRVEGSFTYKRSTPNIYCGDLVFADKAACQARPVA